MSSGSLSERERLVLGHLARYRLSFKEILSYLYFDLADPQKTLDRLVAQGLVQAEKGFGGNRSAYRLLPPACFRYPAVFQYPR